MGADALDELLAEAQRRRLLGPGDIAAHRRHAEGFAEVLEACGGAGRVVDLGSGAGLPGLPLAMRLPSAEVVLVDRREARTDWLRRAVGRLGLGDRVVVLTGDAASLGWTAPWHGWADAVVARAFGAPGVVAEVARPFLVEGGLLVVSEPPDAAASRASVRGPSDALAELGFVRENVGAAGYAVCRVAGPSGAPRRTSSQIERAPLF